MHEHPAVKQMLTDIRDGRITVEDGMKRLQDFPFSDIGHTRIDGHRQLRNGLPEVIYAEGKTPDQVLNIFEHMMQSGNILATRVSEKTAETVKARHPKADFNPMARTLTYINEKIVYRKEEIGIITAGTSDLPVAEEALVTCKMLGSHATLLSDMGVAGIHRLFDRLDQIRSFSVLIVVAGMEGALSSVIGGLVSQPIIAVPTSVGYGANFSGLSALLGMLTSCAAGVTVVNIDNGFGAACAACRIHNRL